MTTNRIYKELKKRIEAANFEAITVTMNCNGDRITITPCWYGIGAPAKMEDVEYFLVDACMVNLYGDDSLEKVAKTIANYENLLKQADQGIESLKAHIRDYGENSDWDFVSDYHKDLFGHRPHVATSQIIAWAFSDSKDSARYYA